MIKQYHLSHSCQCPLLRTLTLSSFFSSFFSKSCCPAGQRCLCCMASGQAGQLEVGASESSALAKPLYLQRLERTLRLDSFLRQTAAIFNRDITRYRQFRGSPLTAHFWLLESVCFRAHSGINLSRYLNLNLNFVHVLMQR